LGRAGVWRFLVGSDGSLSGSRKPAWAGDGAEVDRIAEADDRGGGLGDLEPAGLREAGCGTGYRRIARPVATGAEDDPSGTGCGAISDEYVCDRVGEFCGGVDG